MRKASKARVAIISVCVLCAIALVARIAWVNINAPHNLEEHHSMGEWIDLSGTYFDNLDEENYDGYSICVGGAEVMSLNEYRAKYASGEYADEEIPGMNGDDKSILVVDYEIRNDGNAESGIPLIDQSLIPESKNVDYSIDYDIWRIAEPASEESQGVIGILPNTEYVCHVPYTFVSNPPYFQTYDYEIRMPVEDGNFEFFVSNGPIRKVIDISV